GAAPTHGAPGCGTRCWTHSIVGRVLLSYQWRLRASVTRRGWTMRLPDRSSGSASPRFSRHRRTRPASSLPMMILASEPPIKERRSTNLRNFTASVSILCTRDSWKLLDYRERDYISYKLLFLAKMQ